MEARNSSVQRATSPDSTEEMDVDEATSIPENHRAGVSRFSPMSELDNESTGKACPRAFHILKFQ